MFWSLMSYSFLFVKTFTKWWQKVVFIPFKNTNFDKQAIVKYRLLKISYNPTIPPICKASRKGNFSCGLFLPKHMVAVSKIHSHLNQWILESREWCDQNYADMEKNSSCLNRYTTFWFLILSYTDSDMVFIHVEQRSVTTFMEEEWIRTIKLGFLVKYVIWKLFM